MVPLCVSWLDVAVEAVLDCVCRCCMMLEEFVDCQVGEGSSQKVGNSDLAMERNGQRGRMKGRFP